MDASSPSAPRWVDRLFSRLQVRYGSAWTRMWVGIEPEAVKADWASMLGQLFDRNPSALVYGLDHLPDTPPTAGVFLKLCLAAPDERKALPAPTAKPGTCPSVSPAPSETPRPPNRSTWCATSPPRSSPARPRPSK